MRVLLVEDDIKISKNISFYLTQHKYIVDSSRSVIDAKNYLLQNEYDVILLDWMLPDGEGISLLKDKTWTTPVIMITAKAMLNDKVEAFELGIDDYLTKPFMLPELLARIRSVVRRSNNLVNSNITVGDVTIDLNKYQVLFKNQVLDITGKAYAVIEYLALKVDQVVPRSDLSERVLDSSESDSNLVDVYIANIRKEIRKYSDKEYIKTVKGVGYMLCSN